MRYLCKRCLNNVTLFNNFQEFRFHMEYDHGLWFLAQTTNKKFQEQRHNTIIKTTFPIVDSKLTKTRNVKYEKDVRSNRKVFAAENDDISNISLHNSSKKDDLSIDSSSVNLKESHKLGYSMKSTSCVREEEPFLTTFWPTDLILRLHEKEKEIQEMHAELQLSKVVQKEMEEQLKSLQFYYDANKHSLEDLNQSLIEKDSLITENQKEILYLKNVYQKHLKENEKVITDLKTKISNLIEKTRIAETRIHDAHLSLKIPVASGKLLAAHDRHSISTPISFNQNSIPGYTSDRKDKNLCHTFQKRKPLDKQFVISYEKQMKGALFLVFRYLDPISLFACSQVNRVWYECTSDPELWKEVCFSHHEYTNKNLNDIAPFCAQTEALIFEKLPYPKKKENETAIEYQTRIRGALEPGLEFILQNASNSIKQINIIDCGMVLSKRSVWLVSCYCRSLEKLVYISDVDPLNAEVLWSLGFGCRKLSALIIPPLHPSDSSENFTNQALNIISEAFHLLRILCIGGNQIDVQGLTCIAKHCELLQQLELDHMREIREKTAITTCHYGFKGLLMIAFTFTVVTPKAIVHFYRSCPNLKTIVVQLEFTTYFPNPSSNSVKNKEKYTNLIQHIEILKNHSHLGEILKLFIENIS